MEFRTGTGINHPAQHALRAPLDDKHRSWRVGIARSLRTSRAPVHSDARASRSRGRSWCFPTITRSTRKGIPWYDERDGFLLDGRGRPIRLGLGTHDVALIEQIAEQVGPAGIERSAFEVQMLYGIRTDQQFRLAKAGYRVQALIAYGEFWYPWYMRRLAERPANVWFALRQMLP